MDRELTDFIIGKIRIDYAGDSDLGWCKECKMFVVSCDYEGGNCDTCNRYVCHSCTIDKHGFKCRYHDTFCCEKCFEKQKDYSQGCYDCFNE